jgi:hypothetical protein
MEVTMSKQTAVKLLEQAYWDNKGTLSQKHFDQAKQMEKEQIEEAWDEGQECEYQYHINAALKYNSNTYYNETYGETKN